MQTSNFGSFTSTRNRSGEAETDGSTPVGQGEKSGLATNPGAFFAIMPKGMTPWLRDSVIPIPTGLS